MTFVWPWSLLALTAVAAVALWSLFRPARQRVIVGSLQLWTQAAAALKVQPATRRAGVTPAWLCLLAGAVLAGLAMARPAYLSHQPRRNIALAIVPSAELIAPDGARFDRLPINKLLGRLGGADRVQIILPDVAGGASAWLSPSEAADAIARIEPLPARAADMSLPTALPLSQRMYYFGPNTTSPPSGPRIDAIALAAAPRGLTIEAAGLASLPNGKTQLFASFAKGRGTAGDARLAIEMLDRDGRKIAEQSAPLTAAPDGSMPPVVVEVPPASAAAVHIVVGGKAAASAFSSAYFAAASTAKVKVAMIGPDEPLIRRFVRVHPNLVLVAAPADADVIIASGDQPPAGKAALVIHPASPPPSWTAGQPLENVALADANVAADDPLLTGVELHGVVLRRAEPWQGSAESAGKRLITYKSQVLALASAGDDAAKPRVYLAFDLGIENANMGPAMVALLANAIEFLAPAAAVKEAYMFATPLQAGDWRSWKPVSRDASGRQDVLPWPGLYRNQQGHMQAVTLLAGVDGAAAAPSPVWQDVASVTLPPPQEAPGQVELWPWLVLAAMGFWLLGWAWRVC